MGNGDQFTMNPAALKDCQDALLWARGELKRINNNMDGDIVSMQGDWQGRGGRSFREANNTWVVKAEEMNRTLDTIEQGLGMTSRDTQATDEMNTEGFTRGATDLSALGPLR